MRKKEKKVNATADNRRMERNDRLMMNGSPGKQHGTDCAKHRAGRAYPLVFDSHVGDRALNGKSISSAKAGQGDGRSGVGGVRVRSAVAAHAARRHRRLRHPDEQLGHPHRCRAFGCPRARHQPSARNRRLHEGRESHSGGGHRTGSGQHRRHIDRRRFMHQFDRRFRRDGDRHVSVRPAHPGHRLCPRLYPSGDLYRAHRMSGHLKESVE